MPFFYQHFDDFRDGRLFDSSLFIYLPYNRLQIASIFVKKDTCFLFGNLKRAGCLF